MTDRYAGFVVMLDKDMREDDSEATIAAIRMIKGVVGVEPVLSSPEGQIVERRVRRELTEKIWKALE